MNEHLNNRSIRIEERVVGSAIVSGDGNIVYVIQQTIEQQRNEVISTRASGIGPNPYKGLAAFKESDADRYFGREAQIKRLWQRFQNLYHQSTVPRFLPILGPSGCGKSSLAQAGFIPELARRPLPGKERMRVAVLVPGSYPLEALAGVLAKVATGDPLPVEKTEEFERVLKKPNGEGKYDGLRRIASLIPGIQDEPLVILIDQFEELYSLQKDPNAPKMRAQQRVFIDTLLYAASDPSGNVSVVITLRSDFLGDTQRHQGLNQIIGSDQSVIVPAMTKDELSRAIAEPANQVGRPFDDAIVDQMVKDTEGREGALPLLQFALTRIWEELLDGKSPTETFRAMNGVGGALAEKAQSIYNSLITGEKEIARQIFIRLIQVNEGSVDTRRRISMKSLITNQSDSNAVEQLIIRFSSPGARLITLSNNQGKETVEITHEALFIYWETLANWIHESRDLISRLNEIEHQSEQWIEEKSKENGRPEEYLLKAIFLKRAIHFQKHYSNEFPLSHPATQLIKQSKHQRKKQNLQKSFVPIIVASVTAIVAIDYSVHIANIQNSYAQVEQNKSKESLAFLVKGCKSRKTLDWTPKSMLNWAPINYVLERRFGICRRLEYVQLSESDLSGAHLSGANLNHGNFDKANLRLSDLSYATFFRSNFTEAMLPCANLSDTSFVDAVLIKANLHGVSLRNAYLYMTYLDGADLSYADLSNADLTGSSLKGTNLSYANLHGADLSGAYLRDANLEGAYIYDAILNENDRNYAVRQGAIVEEKDPAAGEYIPTSRSCERALYGPV